MRFTNEIHVKSLCFGIPCFNAYSEWIVRERFKNEACIVHSFLIYRSYILDLCFRNSIFSCYFWYSRYSCKSSFPPCSSSTICNTCRCRSLELLLSLFLRKKFSVKIFLTVVAFVSFAIACISGHRWKNTIKHKLQTQNRNRLIFLVQVLFI